MGLLEYSASFYSGTHYTGIVTVPSDSKAVEGDPMLVLPADKNATTNMSYNGSIPGTTSLLASGLFAVNKNSPCVKNGKVICGAPMGITEEPVNPPVDPSEPTPTEPQATTPSATEPSGTQEPADQTGLIIGIVVAATVVAGGVAFFALKNKKNA